MMSAKVGHEPNFRKLFVGGLSYTTNDENLRNYFSKYGEIEEAVVITDRHTNKSRGYGFVTMKTVSDAERAVREPNPIIDGRKTNVNIAFLGAKPRQNTALSAVSQSPFFNAQIPQIYNPLLQTQALGFLQHNDLNSVNATASNRYAPYSIRAARNQTAGLMTQQNMAAQMNPLDTSNALFSQFLTIQQLLGSMLHQPNPLLAMNPVSLPAANPHLTLGPSYTQKHTPTAMALSPPDYVKQENAQF